MFFNFQENEKRTDFLDLAAKIVTLKVTEKTAGTFHSQIVVHVRALD